MQGSNRPWGKSCFPPCRQFEHNLDGCSSAASFLLKPAGFQHACPTCLLPGLSIQDSMSTPHGHMPLGSCWWTGLGLRESLSAGLHLHLWPPGVSSKRVDTHLSFQGTWADPEGVDNTSGGFGGKQYYLRLWGPCAYLLETHHAISLSNL